MGKLLPLPLQLSGQPFTLDQARRAGLTASRVQGRDLWTPSRAIRLPLHLDCELLDMCRALTQVTPNSAISHLTAAKLHGLFLPAKFQRPGPVDLAKVDGGCGPRRNRIAGHKLTLGPGDLVVMGGVPVTSGQRTLLDIAELIDLDSLVVIADQIVCAHDGRCVRFKLPMMELDALKTYIIQHTGARGLRKLLRAMELVRVGADSAPETQLRLIIVRSPLPDFEPNRVLTNANGKPLVQPDLSCEEFRTCIEYEGKHHFTPEQQAKDHDRDYLTKSLGWNQVLINKDDIQAGERVVVTKIARMLTLGGWPDPLGLAQRSLLGRLHTRKDIG
ncbi:MAG: DUF559 domain-containing protein [Specibacter sp.]